jgi:hypothetical protein
MLPLLVVGDIGATIDIGRDERLFEGIVVGDGRFRELAFLRLDHFNIAGA